MNKEIIGWVVEGCVACLYSGSDTFMYMMYGCPKCKCEQFLNEVIAEPFTNWSDDDLNGLYKQEKERV